MNEISEPDVRARLDALERRADNFEERSTASPGRSRKSPGESPKGLTSTSIRRARPPTSKRGPLRVADADFSSLQGRRDGAAIRYRPSGRCRRSWPGPHQSWRAV